MAVSQADDTGRSRVWGKYLLIGMGALVSALFIFFIIYFWGEMTDVRSLGHRYGYLGGFVISVFGGITVVPLPSLLAIFTLGAVLDPLYLGLVSGFGEALGGITIYLTGAGGAAIWARFRSRERTFYNQQRVGVSDTASDKPKGPARWQRLYDRMLRFVEGRGAMLSVFMAAAFLWGIFYPVALAAGTLRMGLKRFFLISLLGKTIRGLIVAYAGYWGLQLILRWLGA